MILHHVGLLVPDYETAHRMARRFGLSAITWTAVEAFGCDCGLAEFENAAIEFVVPNVGSKLAPILEARLQNPALPISSLHHLAVEVADIHNPPVPLGPPLFKEPALGAWYKGKQMLVNFMKVADGLLVEVVQA